MSERFVVDLETPCMIKDTKSVCIFSVYVNPNNNKTGELDFQQTKRMAQFICDKLNAEWDEEES